MPQLVLFQYPRPARSRLRGPLRCPPGEGGLRLADQDLAHPRVQLVLARLRGQRSRGGGPAAGSPPAGLDTALALRSFERVQDTVRRCVASGRFPGRDPQAVSVQLWALVHGLASLEVRGFLGPGPAALARWDDAVRDAVTAFEGVTSR